MRYCFRIGLYRQGLLHDLSKYSPTEFLVGAKYYQAAAARTTRREKRRGCRRPGFTTKGETNITSSIGLIMESTVRR